jgi:hypothetical protein
MLNFFVNILLKLQMFGLLKRPRPSDTRPFNYTLGRLEAGTSLTYYTYTKSATFSSRKIFGQNRYTRILR